MRALLQLLLTALLCGALFAAVDNRAVADAAFDELVRQDFQALARRFSPEMSAALPAEKLAAAAATLTAFGALRSPRPEPQTTSRGGQVVFTYTAEFEKARLNVVIAVNTAGQLTALGLMPAPAEAPRPGELTISAPGDLRLPATLTVPDGDGPFPAVVLVHGSGPQDRDETVGANAPFRDLAAGLARRGIATLRYVKRTRQAPSSPVAMARETGWSDRAARLWAMRRTCCSGKAWGSTRCATSLGLPSVMVPVLSSAITFSLRASSR